MSERKKRSISYEAGYTIRAVAMLMIIFVHCANEYRFFTSEMSRALLVPCYGYLGCAAFFFMSGFGLYCSYHKEHYSNRQLINKLKNQLITLLFPYLLAFLASYLFALFIPTYSGDANAISNLLCLSMPDGNPIWFLKITLTNYIICTLLLLVRRNNKTTAIALLIVQFAIVCGLYACKMPLYWYASNLAFCMGWFYANDGKSTKLIIPISLAMMAVLSACGILCISNAPLFILGSLAFCVLLVTAVSLLPTGLPRWLKFIGKNSLYFYLFNIPIMNAIPSEHMSCLSYFVINLTATAFVIYIYLNLKSYRILRQRY